MLYSHILTPNLLVFNELYFCHVLKKNIDTQMDYILQLLNVE
jgi:hypothetical protein